MPQHPLGRKNNQRLAHSAPIGAAMHLTTKHVKILSWSAGVHHLQIVLGAKLQEAFNASAGMLGTLSFIAMRQQQNQSAGLAPLGFGAGDELIDHDLRAIYEVAEL